MASLNLLWFFCLFVISTSASSIVRRHASLPCPHDCHCATNHTTQLITYHCSSLDFVNKLSSKENAVITSLDISNISLHSLDKRLKKLVNLERLNLANNKLTDLKHFPHMSKLTHLNLRANHIKTFVAKHLPSTLRSLDVSHTYIRELPRDITRLHHLKHIAVYGNSFSCNRESLETRDFLLENEVKLVGHATCEVPEKFKGQSWFHVVDFDEFFRLHDQEGMLADEPDGSGDDAGSGAGALYSGIKFLDPIEEEPIQRQHIDEVESAKTSTAEPETTTFNDMYFSGDGPIKNGDDKESDPTSDETIPERTMEVPEEKHANLGTNIFLGIFLLCLVALLIYAIKKNKERKREARRKKRQENLKQRAAQIEMMPKNQQRKPSDKQNGNSEQVPLMNGQNGNSKPADANDLPSDNSQPLLEKEPVNNENNGDYISPSAPLYPTNSDVKTVKVKASEIPDSVPQTPILVSRSRTSDGNLVVTPKPTQRNS